MLISNQYLTNLTDFVSSIKAIVNIHVSTCFISTFFFFYRSFTILTIYLLVKTTNAGLYAFVLSYACKWYCVCVIKQSKTGVVPQALDAREMKKCHRRRNNSDTHTSN